MKNLLTAFALLATLSATAQTEKTVKLNDTTQLTYDVASDGKTKEGTYAIKNLKNKGLWVQGHYKADERNGTWYFFNAQNQLTMRYNFDQKKLLYVNDADLKDVSINILNGDADMQKNASAPLPLCPIDYFVALASSKIYAMNVDAGNIDAEITAYVSADGTAKYTVSYKTANGKVEKQKFNINDTKFNVQWLPSTYKDKPVDAEFVVYTSIKANGEGWRRNKWNN
ncbi:hypothetical protein [Mucilaginibacter gynuensis]